MESKEKELAEEIVAYIEICRSSLDSWYTGITSNPAACLQQEHEMSLVNTLCVCREVSSAVVAVEVVSILMSKYGLDGKTVFVGDERSIYVYAFHKKTHKPL